MTSKENLLEVENLEWFFNNYNNSVKRGKPNMRAAKQLKTIIDIIQIYSIIK